MATFLQTSGSISMSQINTVFGRGTNLNAYRGTTYYTATTGPNTFPSTSSAISFNNFYGTGPSSAVTVNINALTDTFIASYDGIFPVTASISFFNDGTYIIENGPNPQINGNWATPTTSGVGSSYWISWVRVGVVGTNGTSTASSGGRLAMSTTRIIACNKNSGGTTDYTAEYDLEIWDAASGGTRVGYAPGFTLVASRV
jgi:hypothetical protein